MLEIVVDGLFDFDDKYGGTADFRIPASLEESEHKALHDAAVAVYDALGCTGVARVDFFLEGEDLYVSEINTIPGFTATSVWGRLMGADGFDYPGLIQRLIDLALERHQARAAYRG